MLLVMLHLQSGRRRVNAGVRGAPHFHSHGMALFALGINSQGVPLIGTSISACLKKNLEKAK